jgi:hypothetical protein
MSLVCNDLDTFQLLTHYHRNEVQYKFLLNEMVLVPDLFISVYLNSFIIQFF